MKKSLVLMAMAGVALASCVNDVAEVAQNEQKKAFISFQVPVLYDNTESRANVFEEYNNTRTDFNGKSYPTAENFKVFSRVYTGTFSSWDDYDSYWDLDSEGDEVAVEVTYNNAQNGWTFINGAEIYYWPTNGQKLAFAAYSPADLAPLKKDSDTEKESITNQKVSYTKDGFEISNFQVADDPHHQFELLYSSRSLNNTANDAGVYNGAKIKFKHALSSIHFALIKDADVTEKIYLQRLTVKNLYKKGTFKQQIDEEDQTANPVWTTSENNDAEYVTYQMETGGAGLEFPTTFPVHVDKLSDAINDDYSCPLLMIPQTLAPTTTDEPVIEVVYRIGDDKDEQGKYYVKTITPVLKGRFGRDMMDDGKSVAVDAWLPGKKYTYVLHYSKGSQAKDQIYFAPEVSPWESVDQIYIELQ